MTDPLHDAVEGLLSALGARDGPTGTTEATNALAPSVVDWATFWDRDREASDWLLEPIIAAGRSHAIYAGAKQGKSYVTLQIAAALATGRAFLGKPASEPISVVYVDFEMTEDDLADRMEDFGYGADDDLSHLHYALLPSIPALNGPEGAKVLVDYAKACGARLVIIDTFARAVDGEENDAATVNDYYRWTGLALKAEGIAQARLDHAGKDATKGQRGSSAKDGDVDVVWRLTKRDDNAVLMEATHRRMGWVPERVELEWRTRPDGSGGHHLAPSSVVATWPAGTKECADDLDALGLEVGVTCAVARKALTEAKKGRQSKVVAAAVRYRRMEAERLDLLAPEPVDNLADNPTDGPVTTMGNDDLVTKRVTPPVTDETPASNGPVTPVTPVPGEWVTPPPYIVRGADPTPAVTLDDDDPDLSF